jgi:hypothetical protein
MPANERPENTGSEKHQRREYRAGCQDIAATAGNSQFSSGTIDIADAPDLSVAFKNQLLGFTVCL